MSEDAPRLVATPEAPIPLGLVLETFHGRDGAPLRAACFRPEGEARGSVILSPGRTEPIEKYFEVIEELLGRGLVVLVHDWRGQGLSHRLLRDRSRGHCQDWRCYVSDHEALIDAFEARLPRPRIALTHSMGGCFVAVAAPHEPRLDAMVMSAPMFGVALGGLPVWLATGVARLFCLVGFSANYVSKKTADPMHMAFEHNLLTHDRRRWDRHRAQLLACPDLMVGGVTWGWLDNALQAMAKANRPETAAAITKPLLIIAAGREGVVDNKPAKAFAARAPQGRYVEIGESRHEILMEVDAVRAAFWAQFDALLDSVSPPSA